MKSIEEKAQRYDKALERAKGVIEQNPLMEYLKKGIEYILPELKEGDGEKWIPKEIAKYLKEKGDFRSCWLAWLEKQCEQKLYVNDNAKEMFIKALERVEEQNNKGYKLTDCDKNSWWEDFKAYTSCTIEQKPADKAEPKYHEGEWLCENEPNNYARFIQILEIANVQGKDRYIISRDIHEDEDVIEFGFVEKYYHKFDIQDAKDGDVLHSTGFHNDCIFIFNRLDNWKFDEPNGNRAVATGYCCLSISADKMEFGIQGPDCVEVNTIKPATKIQRDLLFQKMHEAGYEWDADKKELKKIEDEIEIPFGAKDSDLQEATYYIPKGFHAEIDDDKVVIKKGEKSVWSEEDMSKIQRICKYLDEAKKYYADITEVRECIDWLKSLKERYAWLEKRPKDSPVISNPSNTGKVEQKPAAWSEEDEAHIMAIDLAVNRCLGKWHCCGEKCPISEHNPWLKSLKDRVQPQFSWKPSDEQMDTLKFACGGNYVNLGILESLYQDLKKLK